MDAISGLNSADDVEVAFMTTAVAEAGATAATEEDEGFLAMGGFSTDTAELLVDPSTASVEALMTPRRVSDGVTTEADTPPPTDAAEVSEPVESPLKPFVVEDVVFNGSALPPTLPEDDDEASGGRFKD